MSNVIPADRLVRSPLAWAADCRDEFKSDPDSEAKAAFQQLAEEFENVASEIEGLVSTYEAIAQRKAPHIKCPSVSALANVPTQ